MNQILAVVSESALEGREGIDQVRGYARMRATAITPGFGHKMHEVVISKQQENESNLGMKMKISSSATIGNIYSNITKGIE